MTARDGWLGWPKDCVLSQLTWPNTTGREEDLALHPARPLTCAALAIAKGSLFASAGRQSLRIQSHRTRVIGEGVSAHVNVMDSWTLALSVPQDGYRLQ